MDKWDSVREIPPVQLLCKICRKILQRWLQHAAEFRCRIRLHLPGRVGCGPNRKNEWGELWPQCDPLSIFGSAGRRQPSVAWPTEAACPCVGGNILLHRTAECRAWQREHGYTTPSLRGEEQQQQLSDEENWLKYTVGVWTDKEKKKKNIWMRQRASGINWDTVVMVNPRGACWRPWLFSLIYLCLPLFFQSFWCTRPFGRWLRLKL